MKMYQYNYAGLHIQVTYLDLHVVRTPAPCQYYKQALVPLGGTPTNFVSTVFFDTMRVYE